MPGQKANMELRTIQTNPAFLAPPRPSRKAFGLHQQAEPAESAQAPSVSPEQVGKGW